MRKVICAPFSRIHNIITDVHPELHPNSVSPTSLFSACRVLSQILSDTHGKCHQTVYSHTLAFKVNSFCESHSEIEEFIHITQERLSIFTSIWVCWMHFQNNPHIPDTHNRSNINEKPAYVSWNPSILNCLPKTLKQTKQTLLLCTEPFSCMEDKGGWKWKACSFLSFFLFSLSFLRLFYVLKNTGYLSSILT